METAVKCECQKVFVTPCDSKLPVDCKVVFEEQILNVTSDCLYACLDTDKCDRDMSKGHPF